MSNLKKLCFIFLCFSFSLSLLAESNATTEETEQSQVTEEAQSEQVNPEQTAKEKKIKKEIEKANLEIKLLRKRMELNRVKKDFKLHSLKMQQSEIELHNKYLDSKYESQILSPEVRQLKVQQSIQAEMYRSDIAIRDLIEKIKSRVSGKIEYTKNPFKNGILTISDRRIPLNGPIIRGYAEYVTNRIHYYNNKSTENPIFIVIDRSPGGSVMEGYRIVQAMQNSKAPVYVVVKSFAASMAAVITTLAERSYAYPNAIVLHHQLSYGWLGNVTEHDEMLEVAKEWERRLAEPVAEKMGITIKEFKKKMYESRKSGDWEEFADEAVKLRWIDNVAKGVVEQGIREKPTDEAPKPFFFFFLKEEVDQDGKAHMTLPKLQPFDFYFIYDNDNYYRVRQ